MAASDRIAQVTRIAVRCVLALLLAAVLTCAAATAGRAAESSDGRSRVLAAMQEVMGPLPPSPSAPPRLEILEESRFEHFTLKKITFDTADGNRVPAYLLIPSRPGRRAAVLCLHQTTAIGKGEPAGLGGKPNLHYARELAERGYITLAPDYPNFGDYHLDVYNLGYASATMKGIVNHRRAIDVLRSLPNVDARRIGVIGHSLGGHNALFLAAFDTRVRAVVTSCGFTSFAKYMGGDLTGWTHKGYMPRIASAYGKSPARMPFEFRDVLAAIAPRPIFVNAPLADDNFDASGVDDSVRDARVFARTALHTAPHIFVEHPACGHDFPPDVRERAYRFLDRSLR